MFSTLVASAFFLRRNREAHKRLMLLAYISIIVAAVARLPGVLPLGPLGFFGLAFIFLLIAVIYDLISRRNVHTRISGAVLGWSHRSHCGWRFPAQGCGGQSHNT